MPPLSGYMYPQILSTPIGLGSCSGPKISLNTSMSATRVVPWPQNAFLKTQCASPAMGVIFVKLITPPNSTPRYTAHVRIPPESMRSHFRRN